MFFNKKFDVTRVPPIQDPENIFHMPAEEHTHEGTWLQWPHNFGWDAKHVERYEGTWIELARALHTGERVHIVVYNESEHKRVQALLAGKGLNVARLDFYEWPTDDVWVRDNGPIFVFDKQGEQRITNWGFNGWGEKAEYYHCHYIPIRVGNAIGVPVSDVCMTNEGGSVEVDGRGTLMAKKSSILNKNRNKGWKQGDAEAYFRKYLGVTNFIWLEGKMGGDDITDDHIDGTARFANGDTIVTLAPEDMLRSSEYKVLQKAVDVNGKSYKIVHLPLTEKKVKGVGDYGFYINFYVGNEVVVVPSYDDPSDKEAVIILAQLYPTRKVVSIDCRELYKDGGMIHCVTQQQPAKR